jgi:hypothetical protein
MPPGEWRAYGRSGLAQRYSPLTLITPENGTKAGDAVMRMRCRDTEPHGIDSNDPSSSSPGLVRGSAKGPRAASRPRARPSSPSSRVLTRASSPGSRCRSTAG